MQRFLNPCVEQHLISDEGEEIIDEVRKHPMAVAWALVGLVGCMLLFLAMPFAGPVWPIPLLAGLLLFLRCVWAIHGAHMDRFVITNMRVFRVHGIVSQQTATMPMQRILDITVNKPILGQIFGYGHFVFESAAQDQGLRDIRYVARPDERDLTIQRVIQRSGARQPVRRRDQEAM
ncbi:PH domain-containing protein [Granulicoccus sp. GXG6511]|uniref:PH domain-containing protein n=1 Tax=Granulicoccus sp. GXG6511 TaxID=3381351 RepID=UPI003D7F0589